MALRCRLHLGAVVLALGLLAVGCTKSDPLQPTPPPSTAGQPTSSSPSPTPTVPASEAAAIARGRAYVAMVDKLRSNPKANLDQLSTVARGKAADNWRRILLNDRSAAHRQTGTTKLSLLSAKVGTSDQQWVVTMCLDVSDVDILDRNGQSIVAKNRPDRVRDVLTVDQDTTSSQWYVAQDEVTATC